MEIIKLEGYHSLYAVDTFFPEYEALFGKSKRTYANCLKKLRVNLGILDAEGENVILYQQFERLKSTELYAIRHVGESNPRVIFAFIDGDGRAILLTSFKEKRASDYAGAIRRAELRLRQLKEEA